MDLLQQRLVKGDIYSKQEQHDQPHKPELRKRIIKSSQQAQKAEPTQGEFDDMLIPNSFNEENQAHSSDNDIESAFQQH